MVWVAGEVTNNALYTNGTVVIDPDCYSQDFTSSGVLPADVNAWLCEYDFRFVHVDA